MKREFATFLFSIYLAGLVSGFCPSAVQQRRIPAFSSAIAARNDDNDDNMIIVENSGRRDAIINAVAGGLLVASGVATWQLYKTEVYTPTGFRRISPIQFIAALGDPKATSGTGAQDWGIWKVDPGPRGVWLKDYESTLGQKNGGGGVAPAGWKFDPQDWWVEEHGLIMESPSFPLPAGRYLVTGGRSVTTGLTVETDGRWVLDEGTLYDVTHLPCRSARYNPIVESGSPAAARLHDFPVRPGAVMPEIPGTVKQDYAVLFIVGRAS